jgi:hypothetical protein
VKTGLVRDYLVSGPCDQDLAETVAARCEFIPPHMVRTMAQVVIALATHRDSRFAEYTITELAQHMAGIVGLCADVIATDIVLAETADVI